jgi:hypothetical protein
VAFLFIGFGTSFDGKQQRALRKKVEPKPEFRSTEPKDDYAEQLENFEDPENLESLWFDEDTGLA